MKWTTTTQYVDTETGEILRLGVIINNHYIKIKQKSTARLLNRDYGKKEIIWYCERNRQTTINFKPIS